MTEKIANLQLKGACNVIQNLTGTPIPEVCKITIVLLINYHYTISNNTNKLPIIGRH